MTPQHRSYSQINQLRTCGHQFYLERVARKPRRPSVPAVAGKIIHKATEAVDQAIYAWDSAMTRDEQVSLLMIGQYEAEIVAPEIIAEDSEHYPPSEWKRYGKPTEAKPNAEDLDWFLEVAIPQAIKAYVDWRLENLSLFTLAEIPDFGPAIEVPFMYYLPNGQLVHGWIDRVFQAETEQGLGYYPVDLKSGRKPDSDEQLGLYGAFLKKALGWDIHWGYYLYGLKTGEAKQTAPLPISHWTDEKLASIYVPATQLIDQGIYIAHPGEACFHCGVSEYCDYRQSAL